MVREVIDEFVATIENKNAVIKALLLIIYILFIVLSVVSGDWFPVVFIFFSLVLSCSLYFINDSFRGHICDFMTPLDDVERKNRGICRSIVFALAKNMIMFTGIITAMLWGGHDRMRENFVCVLLFQLIGTIKTIHNKFYDELKITWMLRRMMPFISLIVWELKMFLILILFCDNTFFSVDMTSVFENISRTKILIIEFTVIALQLLYSMIILKCTSSDQGVYEYRE